MFLAALASVLFALILIAYWRKLVLQFMYLNLKAHEKQASQWKFLSTKLPKEIAERRSQAILLFPFFYGVSREDEGHELNVIKNRIRNIHFAIYFAFSLIIILGLMMKGPSNFTKF